MKVLAVLLVIGLALFASCTKNSDGPPTAPGIKGTWNVTYLKRHSIVRDVSNVLGQPLLRTTEISHTTQNTQGTFVIDDSLISVVGLTYAFPQQPSYNKPLMATTRPTKHRLFSRCSQQILLPGTY